MIFRLRLDRGPIDRGPDLQCANTGDRQPDRRHASLVSLRRGLALVAGLVLSVGLGSMGCSSDDSSTTPDPPSTGHWIDDDPSCAGTSEVGFWPADGVAPKDFCLIYDGALFHLFYIRVGSGWMDGGERDFGHATSGDLLEWQAEPVLDLKRAGVAEDHTWSPHVIRHDEQWWMFYTGVSRDEEPEQNVQRILLATSTDLYRWQPAEFVLEGDPAFTCWGSGEPWANDLRDPMVYEAGDGWRMLATVRLLDGRQCVAVARSQDLMRWEWLGPLLPTAGKVAESATMARFGGRYWLFWTSESGIRAASSDRADAGFEAEPIALTGYANESLRLADGSVLVPRVFGVHLSFARLTEAAGAVPEVSLRVTPSCFDGQLLVDDPTVLLPDAGHRIAAGPRVRGMVGLR